MPCYCDTKTDIIAAFVEAGRPLDSETRLDFDESENQLRELKLGLDFVVLGGKCRICNYEETIITPAVVDLDSMECRNCGNETMQEKEGLEWELSEE